MSVDHFDLKVNAWLSLGYKKKGDDVNDMSNMTEVECTVSGICNWPLQIGLSHRKLTLNGYFH